MDSVWASTIKQSINRVTGKGGDARFFTNTKKGELAELKADLNSNNKEKIKDAIKKVIASMTIGKDVSSLFTDVVKSLATDQLELKKLVYLYIINYARSAPDKAILVVNTFQKDANSSSPLIRALAIRTMGCIHVDRITEYLAEPLSKALRDKDPYVRKTAAIGVAKLYDIAPDLVIDQQFIHQLRELTGDSNPMVVANAVAALHDISTTSGKDVFKCDSALLNKLLSALNECTEWGQIFILDAISQYTPVTTREAEDTVERVVPRLKHANSAVVMSAVRVIINYITYITKNDKLIDNLLNEKLPPPLITLLNEQRSEIQYVALRNIRLLIAKQPTLLQNTIKHFFIKYNDPIYVKCEKLDILLALTNTKNIDKVLLELKEYATEIDVEFVRRAVNCIGRCAIKVDIAAEKCIQLLLELIQTKVQYVVQEAIVVIRDIFRKYPNRYESIISTLCDSLESLDEPEAKASMIWIIGEYADRIDNATELLENFLQSWNDETSNVQLTLLTAIVKLFLKVPEDSKELVGKILQIATNEVDNPDLRDRAYIYWRLLATDPEQAQHVVLAQKPPITDESYSLDPTLLDTLIKNIATLSSVYHKAPEFFVPPSTKQPIADEELEGEDDEEAEDAEGDEYEEEGEDELDVSQSNGGDDGNSSDDEAESKKGEVDLLGLMGVSEQKQAPPAKPAATSTPASSLDQFTTVLTAAQSQGLEVRSRMARRNGQLSMDLYIENQSQQKLSNWAIKFDVNFAGLQPAVNLQNVGTVDVHQTKPFALICSQDESKVNRQNIGTFRVAIKTDIGIFYWSQSLNPVLLLSEDGEIADQQFLQHWRSLADENESATSLTTSQNLSVDELRQRLEKRNIFVVATRIINQQTGSAAIYGSGKYANTVILLELKNESANTLHLAVKSDNRQYNQMMLDGIQQLFS